MKHVHDADVETFRRNVSTSAVYTDPSRFQGYRPQSTRLQGWDYAGNGCYFVTICTRDRLPFLGEIVAGVMNHSPAGEIVAEEWRLTASVRPYVTVDEFIVMPNHLHGILTISDRHPDQRAREARSDVETFRRNVSTSAGPRLIAGSLGAIIGQVKSACTKRIRESYISEFGWQSRFYEHIIRDHDELNRIRQYIIENPANWEQDSGTPANLWI
jgi:REP-associated tyrosine transposase